MIDNTTKTVQQSTVELVTTMHYDWDYSTVARWLKRYRNGEAVCRKRGYPKQEYDLAFLEGRIKSDIKHSRKRSKGTGLLKQLAPRRVIRSMVKAARNELNKKRRDECCHVRWNRPGSVWAMDDTLLKYDPDGRKRYLTNIQDLSSRFKFSYDTTVEPTGENIATRLEQLFKQHGPPLFIKRDNGSNFCSEAVNDVLRKYLVIPINSPVKSPTYNGAIERSQGEIKSEIDNEYLNEHNPKLLNLHLRDICSRLNHKVRSSLKDKHPCECFTQRRTYHKRKRKEIYDKVKYYTSLITRQLRIDKKLKEKERLKPFEVYTAARQAAKQVMLELGIVNITLERTGSEEVLPI